MPNRRKVLIGLGTTVAIAGCSETSETEPEPEPNETETNETEQVTNETEPTNETEEEPEETNETEEESQEEQEPEEIEEIENAKSILDNALQEYVSHLDSDDATILDVTSESEEFDFIPVVNTAIDAEEKLDEAEEFEDRESVLSEIETLREEYNLIDLIARAQNEGQKSVTQASTELNEDYGNAHSKLEDAIPEFEKEINEINSDIGDINSTIVRDLSLYKDKLAQFQDELENLNIIVGINSDFNQATQTLDEANTQYNNEEYDSAEYTAENAEEEFSSISETLSEANSDTLTDIVEEFESSVQSKIISAQSLQDRASNPPDE